MGLNGKLITFEGIDGSGKSTLIQLVADELRKQGKLVRVLQEPGTTEMGLQIRKLIKSDIKRSKLSEILLFEASRADMVENVVKPLLFNHDYILLDRYIDSTLAYQGYGNHNDMETLHLLNNIAIQGYAADASFLIDVSLEEAARRRAMRPEDIDKFDIDNTFANDVYNGYQELAQSGRLIKVKNDNIEETRDKILSYIV